VRTALCVQAQRGAPDEICGLLGGRQRGAIFYVTCRAPVPNCAATPRTHFVMAQDAMLSAIRAIQRAKQELIGVYHSHPFSAPEPSPADLAVGAWQATPYLIIGYAATQPTLAAWLIEGAQVAHLTLI
jgi:proteasome lid subunit RPN8/RPN11